MATDVLGRLVEVISGQSLDELFADRILAPLGMHDTAFWARPEIESRLVTLYSPNPATGQLGRGDGDALGRDRPAFLSGGGGLLSTANDYHRFARMLLNGGELDGVRLLGPRTVQLMTRNHLPGGADLVTFGRPLVDILRPGYGFGLGFQVLVDPVATKSLSSLGEYGWGGAAGTEFWIDPSRELIAMFFTQIMPSLNPLRHQLRQMVYQALLDA
jgi:CubicO group peptidase (beta-lactamase class C family)